MVPVYGLKGKKYQASWAAAAQDTLKQIINYIAIDSPGNAAQSLKKQARKEVFRTIK